MLNESTDDLAGLTALLAEHESEEWDDDRNGFFCKCGEWTSHGWADPSPLAAHQAAVIAAAGWRKTEARDEWGIQTPLENGNVWTEVYSFRGAAQRAADRTVRGKLVRRTRLTFNEFTDWEPA